MTIIQSNLIMKDLSRFNENVLLQYIYNNTTPELYFKLKIKKKLR